MELKQREPLVMSDDWWINCPPQQRDPQQSVMPREDVRMIVVVQLKQLSPPLRVISASDSSLWLVSSVWIAAKRHHLALR